MDIISSRELFGWLAPPRWWQIDVSIQSVVSRHVGRRCTFPRLFEAEYPWLAEIHFFSSAAGEQKLDIFAPDPLVDPVNAMKALESNTQSVSKTVSLF